MKLLCVSSRRRMIFAVLLALGSYVLLLPPSASGQTSLQPIPATQAFEAPACSDVELGGISVDFLNIGHLVTIPSPQRTNPEWKAIITDPSQPPHLQPPKILEGFVTPTPNDETSSSQATAEVAEEDLPWTHYTHDWTFKVLPDPAYQYLLSSWVRFPGVFQPPQSVSPDQNGCPPGFTFFPNPSNPDPLAGTCTGCPGGGFLTENGCQLAAPESCGNNGPTCQHTDMEVEWDNASLMDVSNKEGFARDFGAVPEFVWPAVGDRVWIEGRWIFDCGHPGTPDAAPDDRQYVKFSTEIHPPRALVTFRLNHPALDSFPQPRVSAPNFPAPQSYLPVTGVPVDPATLPPGVPDNGPTQVSMTEADVFISPNGGAANDICTIVPEHCSSFGGHTGAIIPVNDRNYVFDIYPPGTDYLGFVHPRENGNFGVAPPGDASLQYRIVDHFSELPAHACGGFDNSVCVTVDPIICLLDSSTPPPTQAETGCPAVPQTPTRVRVILPFAGTHANFFAKSILVGWDDVPAPANKIRTFQVRLHQFTRIEDGANTDWREFVNVGGQWRYITPTFDTDANNGSGIFEIDGGNDLCHVNPPILELLFGVGCAYYDNTPWTVSVQDGLPIHVGVGGFVARGVEDSDSSLFMCRNYPGVCDTPDFSIFDTPFRAFPFDNDDRIGTYEFDLVGPNYSAPPAFTTQEFGCSIHTGLTSCNLKYQVEFGVQEVTPTAQAPTSALSVGSPRFNQFVSSATPLALSSSALDAEGFQYRFRRVGIAPPPNGFPLPVYPSPLPFPVHWTHTDLPAGSQSVAVQLTGVDDSYLMQWSAESFGNLLESRHAQQLTLDNTPPVITINQPAAAQYTHADSVTIDYNLTDGLGSGVKSDTPKMDGSTTLQNGTIVANHLLIDFFSEMSLGSHTFSVNALDNVDNAGTKSVAFSIVVTPDSLEKELNIFLGFGCIDNSGLANSLTSKIEAAKSRITAGDTKSAINTLAALLNQLEAQAGKHISTGCTDPNTHTQFNPTQVLITDLETLLAKLKTAGITDPILGYVSNGIDGVAGATITLLDAANNVVATTATDQTGFYFFAQTNTLTVGASYTVTVATIPKPYTTSSPASQSFTWSAAQVSLGNFALN
jgi:hypothetical protein